MSGQEISDLREEHFELITAYDATIEAAKQSAHEKAIACIVKGKALVGVREASPMGGIKKGIAIAAVTAACGYGGKYYLETRGFTFAETLPAEAVNLAAPTGYNPPVNVVSDADRLPKPVVPVAAPKPACSPKLTGAALAWCQKQKHMEPLHLPQKNTSIEQIIGRGKNG